MFKKKEGKKMTRYIITDPCYVLDRDVWDKCCEKAQKSGLWDDEVFHKVVSEELEKLSGKKAWATDTGYGDWDNSVFGNSCYVENMDFCADSGMVCVCAMTEPVEEALKKSFPNGYERCVAVIKCEGEVNVEFDKSCGDWTVVKITDDDQRTFYTSSPEEDDEEDDE